MGALVGSIVGKLGCDVGSNDGVRRFGGAIDMSELKLNDKLNVHRVYEGSGD